MSITIKTATETHVIHPEPERLAFPNQTADTNLFNQIPNWQDVIFIKAKYIKLYTLPNPLPPNLQILICETCELKELPPLPSTIRSLNLRDNRLNTLDIAHCIELEDCNFEYNYLKAVPELPSNLVELNVSYNQIKEDITVVPPNLRYLNVSFNFLTKMPTVHDQCRVNYRDNCFNQFQHIQRGTTRLYENTINYNAELFNRRAREMTRGTQITTPTIYTDTQNVHAHSVQKSINKSLAIILEYKPTIKIHNLPSVLCKQIQKSHDILDKKNVSWFTRHLKNFFKIFISFGLQTTVEDWCHDMSISSEHGVNFEYLLTRIYLIALDHEFKDDLFMRIEEELDSARGVCFTGRMGRLVNALSGYVDGVQVGISDREQLQNNIATAVRRNKELYDEDSEKYQSEARKDVEKILDDLGITNQDERTAWLDAV